MEVYLFHQDEWTLRYNCTFFNIDQIPFDQRQHQWIGVTILAMAIIFELIYIPVLCSIHKRAKYPCYKLMRFIGVIDMIVLPINGMFTGLGFINGWVYCSYPTLIYALGTIATNLWFVVALASLFLAFNRCVEMLSVDLGKTLFYGKRIYFWQIIPCIYGLYFFWFEKPVLFSSVLGAWFFNPFVFYYDDFEHYLNYMHSFNNLLVFFSLPALYIIFFIALGIKTSILRKDLNNKDSKRQYGTFVQVLIISSVNVTACAIYVYMQYFNINFFLTALASYMWLFIHGIPAAIYLFMNDTIRKDCKKMFGWSASSKSAVSTIKQETETQRSTAIA